MTLEANAYRLLVLRLMYLVWSQPIHLANCLVASETLTQILDHCSCISLSWRLIASPPFSRPRTALPKSVLGHLNRIVVLQGFDGSIQGVGHVAVNAIDPISSLAPPGSRAHRLTICPGSFASLQGATGHEVSNGPSASSRDSPRTDLSEGSESRSALRMPISTFAAATALGQCVEHGS